MEYLEVGNITRISKKKKRGGGVGLPVELERESKESVVLKATISRRRKEVKIFV